MDVDLKELETRGEESPFVSKFQAFFESQYQKPVESLANNWPEKRSLLVDFNRLEHFDIDLADALLDIPDKLIEAAEMAVKNIEVPTLEVGKFEPHIRFFNLPKDRTPLLRNISSDHLGKLISVEGVVRQLTDVLPKLKVAAWQCRRCGNVYKREQENDRISMPPMCECKHRDFDLLQEESTFIDNQKVQIQEPLEMLKGSEQATILDVIVSDDLVNKIMPGDRTRIVGIVRLRTPKEKNLVYGRFLEAVHLEETAREFDEVEITPEEKKEIETLSKNPKVYELLGKSIAPNIYGHENVKEAIALQLFGGVKKLLPNDTTIRGNIHVLLVGDPGVAKSAILQSVNKIAPKSIYTAGKTSSGVGMTASAVKDDFGEGGWTLKAGALVLANGGIAMIDEFDKMECLTEDALVCLENGELKPICEVFEEAKSQGTIEKTERGTSVRNIQNRFVLSMNENLKLVKRKLLAAHEYPYEGRILEVALQSGESIKVSPNHPFFTSDKNSIRTVKAGLLKAGDFVFVPSCLPAEETGESNEELSRLFGYLAGDGNVTYNPPEKYLLRFTNKDSDLLEDFSDCCETVFSKPVVYPSEIRSDGVVCERLNGQDAVNFMAKNAPGLMEKFDRKFSPSMAYHSLENASHYLRALFDSEGSVDALHHQVSFASTSERLVNEVKALLLKHGILSQIRKKEPKEKRRMAFILRITDNDAIELFASRIGFTSARKQGRLERLLQKSPKERSILNVIPDMGGLLKKIRLELSLMQKECGLNNITYNNFENGVANITVKKARIVLAAFQARALQKAAAESTQKKIRFLELLVNGDIRWRKVTEIRETVPPIQSKSSYAIVYRINSFLRKLRMKPLVHKKMEKSLPELRELLLQKLEAIQQIVGEESYSWGELRMIIGSQFISQSRLVLELGVNQATLSRWLNQKIMPPEKALVRVSDAVRKKLSQDREKIMRLIDAIEKARPNAATKIYDLTVESSHNFIANNIIVHNSEDRSAMHEAMEQGMISVAKAGIVTRFKTDTTILAAANPKFARFDQYKNYLEQIDLPPTLISRFDLFFMIFDVLDRKKDEDIAQHILKTHQAGESLLQYRLKGGVKRKEILELEESLAPAIPGELLKKFIAFARQNIFPVLTKEAIQAISDYYVDLREQGKKQGTYTATHRQLEGLVRLSEASARIRLSNTIEKEDTERAIRMLRTSLQELVVDKETGHLDIDLLTTGQSTSQTNQLKGILGIVQRLNQEHDKVLVEQVFEEAQKMGLDREKTREIIGKLKRNGDLYEPSLGVIKPVPKEF